jgi:hypothetical protein
MARGHRFGALSALFVLFSFSCSGKLSASDENAANQALSSSNLVTAVGHSNGRLAIQFKGQYFAVFHDGENWAVENNVAADDLYIAPLDETKTEAICDPAKQDKAEMLQNCDGIIGDQITQRRVFPSELGGFFHIEGAQYRVEVKQVIRDEKRILRGSGARQVISTKDLFFEVSVIDPLDMNEWKIRLTPKRTQKGQLGMSDEDLNALAVDEEETRPLLATLSTLGGDESERNAIEYLPEVEMEGVYKDVTPQNRRDLVSKTNPALDSAFSQAAGEETDHSYPGVVSGGMRLAKYVEGASTTVHDFQRLYQIFMRS